MRAIISGIGIDIDCETIHGQYNPLFTGVPYEKCTLKHVLDTIQYAFLLLGMVSLLITVYKSIKQDKELSDSIADNNSKN